MNRFTARIMMVSAALFVCTAAPSPAEWNAAEAQQARPTTRDDRRIDEGLGELFAHIIFQYAPSVSGRHNYDVYADRANDLGERALDLWGGDSAAYYYVSGIAVLVYVNYRLLFGEIDIGEARRLITDVRRWRRDNNYAADDPVRDALYEALAALTAGRAEELNGNNRDAAQLYTIALNQLTQLNDRGLLEGGDGIIAKVQRERGF